MTDITMPGQPVDIPLPPAVVETFGCRSDARFVGFYYPPRSETS
jgi:hypothetical protein